MTNNVRIKEVVLMQPKGRREGLSKAQFPPESALDEERVYELVFTNTYGLTIDGMHHDAYEYIKQVYEKDEYDHILLYTSGMMMAMTSFLAAWQEWQSVSGLMDKGLSIIHRDHKFSTYTEQVWWGRALL